MTVLGVPTAPTTADPAANGAPIRNPVRWIVFAVVFAANLMDIFDATIVNIAGYTLAFAVLRIAGARLGDILGRRLVDANLWGTGVFRLPMRAREESAG